MFCLSMHIFELALLLLVVVVLWGVAQVFRGSSLTMPSFWLGLAGVRESGIHADGIASVPEVAPLRCRAGWKQDCVLLGRATGLLCVNTLQVKSLGPDSVVDHYMQILNMKGHGWQDVIGGTIAECVRISALRYVGVCTNGGGSEAAGTYMDSILHAIAAMKEYGVIPCSFPWRAVQLLSEEDTQATQECLSAMKEEWSAVLWMEKHLGAKHWVRKALQHTTWHWYRELMTEAETCKFDQATMDSRGILRKLVLAYSGNKSSLLSTIPVERVFNDLRDAERRGQKSYGACIQNIQCVCIKSVMSKTPRWEHVELADSDWRGLEEKQTKTVRSEIFTPTTANVEARSALNYKRLTSPTSTPPITNPNLFSLGPMSLMQVIVEHTWEMDAPKFESAMDVLWTSQLVPTGSGHLVHLGASTFVVLASGPYTMKVWPLNHVVIRNKEREMES